MNVVLKKAPPALGGDRQMYNGTLIDDLWCAVEAATEKAKGAEAKGAKHSNPEPQAAACMKCRNEKAESESEQLPQALRLSPADWNLCLLLVVHAQLVRALEPRHYFTDAVDVHQVRPVRPPEKFGV